MPSAHSVDSPLRLPLVSSIQTRDNTLLKDARMVNAYAELNPETKEYGIRKRFGVSVSQANVGAPSLGRGVYPWVTSIGTINSIWIFGSGVYSNGTLIGSVNNTGAMFKFVQIRRLPTPLLVFGDGFNAYYTDGVSVVPILDPNFPIPFVKGWAYLDGTLYVMDTFSNIFGSKNLDDPTVWDPLNKIVARIEPDPPVTLIKSLTYVVALKLWSTEVFYDAGNPTGSPLSPVQGGFIPVGCFSADTVQEIDGTIIWATYSKTVSPQIVRMDNLQIQVISTPPIERLLDVGATPGGAFYSWTLKHAGHRFYGISHAALNFTYVYDLDQQMWYPWTDSNGNYWPYVATSYTLSGQHVLQHVSNGSIYYTAADYKYPDDSGVPFPVDIYTSNFDGGLDREKTLPFMRFDADRVHGSSLSVRVSDDDYQTWTNFRKVDLSKERPGLDDCGSFYRRAWHLRHLASTTLRIRAAYLQLDRGTS